MKKIKLQTVRENVFKGTGFQPYTVQDIIDSYEEKKLLTITTVDMPNTNTEDTPKGIEGIVERILEHSPLKAFFEDEGYESIDVYADTKERIHEALTTLQAELMERVEGKRRETYVTNSNLIYDTENVGYNQGLDDTKAIISSVFEV